jgi:hypothetical protein
MSIWFQVEKKPRSRPEWLAPAIWPRTTAIFRCQLMGVQYRFPVTSETQPFADLILGKEDPWESLSKPGRRGDRRRADLAERGMMDILSALLCQVRDTEVARAAMMLGQEIKDKLEPLLAGKIQANIEETKSHRLESGSGPV